MKNPRAAVLILVSAFVCLVPRLALGEGELLSEADRQALLDRLKELEEGADGRAERRAKAALAIFSEASASSDLAHELYLKSVEKVRFQDQKKSSQDFREWKRRHRERQDNAGFRRVLRHQLHWLVLAIEAEDLELSDREALSLKALNSVEAILGDENLEAEQFKTLSQDVTQSVFALAYGLDLKSEWPGTPVNLKDVYSNHILPPLAAKKDYSTFRSAWAKWVRQEARLVEIKAKEPAQKGEVPVGVERFLVEIRPQMLWDLEKELFSIGDQKNASLAMLKHLQTYNGHKKEVEWTKEFLSILQPASEGEELEK